MLDFACALAQGCARRKAVGEPDMSDTQKKPNRQQVYTLLVEIGRKTGDGLPDKATGAALMIYASGVDEAEAVRETVAILKQADCAPLDVSGYGTLAEREAEGHDISDEERALMQRALDENSVIVAQMTPFFD
ncbi:Type II secretory pathway, component PulF [Roseovarius sp. AK1035]|nr:Type II secretory pathway, component PulF [Roseovarius sp. AK1035]